MIKYQNGNCSVIIQKDGTKIIDYEHSPKPIFPMSIDLKITNKCDGMCSWCHENSTSHGKHADVEFILKCLDGLPSGTEIAIGGGNPLEHPYLSEILSALTQRGLIVNMTVNSKHLLKSAIETIQRYRRKNWIHGLGVSWDWNWEYRIKSISDPNTVTHFIVGIDIIESALSALKRGHKCLILGFKKYGRGENVWEEVQYDIRIWKDRTKELLERGHVAFDTLALEQLNIRSYLKPEIWEQMFMGKDGEFTMFLDAVDKTYAISSTAKRYEIGDKGIQQMFENLRKQLCL